MSPYRSLYSASFCLRVLRDEFMTLPFHIRLRIVDSHYPYILVSPYVKSEGRRAITALLPDRVNHSFFYQRGDLSMSSGMSRPTVTIVFPMW
ncbi:hypothetical protein [uncultured Duncaniella sp.]|uniref:hypothetical protein n=1 Tax=uncultured Duncaniella sp. TaxID=2768039 RepID=UPI00262A882F|nr:hypothetical protein [uncultured Duncaniella sp.]